MWKDAEPQIDEHIGFFYQDTAANALERFGTHALWWGRGTYSTTHTHKHTDNRRSSAHDRHTQTFFVATHTHTHEHTLTFSPSGVVESVLVDPAQCEASGPGLTSASVARRTSFMIFVRDGKGRLARHRCAQAKCVCVCRSLHLMGDSYLNTHNKTRTHQEHTHNINTHTTSWHTHSLALATQTHQSARARSHRRCRIAPIGAAHRGIRGVLHPSSERRSRDLDPGSGQARAAIAV